MPTPQAPAQGSDPAATTPVSKGKVKLWAIEVDEDVDASQTVKGTILIQETQINVLFDFRYTCPFISPRTLSQASRPPNYFVA